LDAAFGHLNLDWKEYVEIDPLYYRPAEIDMLRGDAAKARRVLGWKPKVTFEALVRLMVDHDLGLARQETETQKIRSSETRNKARWANI
jgi:GDPmannose 4,6-dehydratase